MTVRFINDCSHYHVGSALVAQEIRRKLEEHDLKEVSAGDHAELYLVNGEGTLHWDFPGVQRIQNEVEGRPSNSRLVIINSLWSKMKRRFQGVSLAVARESLSARSMREDGVSERILTVPDISLCCQHRPAYQGGGGVLVIDSVDPAVFGWLRDVSQELGAEFIKMCDWKESVEALIDRLARADLVISGRFHGVMLAILAGAPFLAAPSNSWKTRGFLSDIGRPEALLRTKEEVMAAVGEKRGVVVDRPTFLSEVDHLWKEVFESFKSLTALPGGPMSPVEPPVIVSSTLDLHGPVVVVGNGPSIQGSGLGRIIDAHDEVVRFNNYQIAGFEADAGTKTTLWSTFGKGVLPASNPPKRCILVHEHSVCAAEMDSIVRVPASFYGRMQAEIRAVSQHKNAESVRPSSGFLVVRFLLENGCGRVHMAGFDHFGKTKSKQHHYWVPKAFGRPVEHDGDAEKLLLQPFLFAGRIAYLG